MLKLYLTGGETNPEPNKSLGVNIEDNTIVSSFEVENNLLNNLFDNVSFDEILDNQGKIIENYRVLALKNYSTDFTSHDIYIYLYDTTDEVYDDLTITYELASSKYKNYYSGFPGDSTEGYCYCIDEYTLPLNPDCISDIFNFDKYTEDNPIFVDILLPNEYILLYIKRKIIVGNLSDFTCSECPKITGFKLKIDWKES